MTPLEKMTNTVNRVMSMGERKIGPTHYFFLEFEIKDERYQQMIPNAFNEYLNERKHTTRSSLGYSGEITWSADNEYKGAVFWTTSELTDKCVHEITTDLLSQATLEIHQNLQFPESSCALMYAVIKNPVQETNDNTATQRNM